MGSAFERRTFDGSQLDSIEAFVDELSNGEMASGWVAEVLGGVIGDRNAVCDLRREGDRVAVAISVDAFESEGNAAEVSMFANNERAFVALLDWAEQRVASAGRDHLDIPAWPGCKLPAELLATRGYRRSHVLYNMRRAPSAIAQPRVSLPAGWRWSPAAPSDARGYYETTRAAFHGMPSAFIASFEQFQERLASFAPVPQLLLSSAGDVAGFVRIAKNDDGSGVLDSLGRHPRHRGLGLGEHIVARGLGELAALGAADVHLEVSATNEAGLALYRQFGFVVTSEVATYRRRL